ncbi:MAG: hypothetical protein ISR65_11460 [Bacteriovoracaceae bacterium]|nr:hypothetical protein [Bacteriovoracaceae bacterium]
MLRIAVLMLAIVMSNTLYGSYDDEFQIKAEIFCSQISEEPAFEYEQNFTQQFIKNVPYEFLVSIFKNYYEDYGRCTGFEYSSQDRTGKFIFSTESQQQINFLVWLKVVDEQYLIDSFLYKL